MDGNNKNELFNTTDADKKEFDETMSDTLSDSDETVVSNNSFLAELSDHLPQRDTGASTTDNLNNGGETQGYGIESHNVQLNETVPHISQATGISYGSLSTLNVASSTIYEEQVHDTLLSHNRVSDDFQGLKSESIGSSGQNEKTDNLDPSASASGFGNLRSVFDAVDEDGSGSVKVSRILQLAGLHLGDSDQVRNSAF